MSLTIQGPVGVGHRAEEATHNAWDTLDEVLVECMQEGFPVPTQRPNAPCPVINPEELAGTTAEHYAVLFALLEEWQGYTESSVAWVKAILEQSNNEMTVIAVDTRQSIRKSSSEAGTKVPSKDIIDDEVKSNPRYRELMNDAQKLSQKKDMLEAFAKTVARRLRILSRFVEIRKEAAGTGSRRYT